MVALGRGARRGRRGAAWAALAFGALIAVFGPLQARAAGSDPALESAAARVGQLATLLDSLSGAPNLTGALPLSQLTPAEALKLASVFDDGGGVDSLQDKIASVGSIGDPDELEDFLDGLDFTSADGIVLSIGGPTSDSDDGEPVVRKSAATPPTVDVFLTVKASKQVQVPISFATDILDVVAANGGGTFPVTFTAETSVLQLQYDAGLDGVPATSPQALSILRQPDASVVPDSPAPSVTVSASTGGTDATLATLSADLGFTAVDITGSLGFHFGYRFELLDPDDPSDGRVSADEFTTTALEDLFAGTFVNGSPSVQATLRVDSTLVPGPTDLTLGYVDGDVGDNVPGTPNFDPNAAILAFRNFTKDDALGALLRLVTLLDSLQATGALDPSLPFVSGGTNAVDPEAAAKGTFSDAVRLGKTLSDKLGGPPGSEASFLSTKAGDAADPNAIGTPTFANAQQLASKLSTLFGGAITPVFLPGTPPRLKFALNLSGDGHVDEELNFGSLDILSGIQVQGDGSIALDASYAANLTFALDLTRQPTEGPNADVGTCTDGVDNDADTLLDALDADCLSVETLEQRVALEVGTDANAAPELNARMGVKGTGIQALAHIGLLQAGVTDANLFVGGSKGEGGVADRTTCHDADDDDGDGLIGQADPDCVASVEVNLTDTQDGWLTIRELLNALGAAPQPNVTVASKLDAGIDSKLSVVADLLPDAPGGELGGGDIVVSGQVSGPLTDPQVLVQDGTLTINADDLHLADLSAFSPCSNTTDDDGDGVVNDGCPDAAEAEGDSEASSTALFNKVVAAVKALAQQLEASGIFPAGTLDQPLPLVGVSFNDLVDFAESFTATADSASNAAEKDVVRADGTDPCTNGEDDDGDGVDNDGCPATGPSSLPESDCADVDLDGIPNTADDLADDDGDNRENDGCQPTLPSVQKLGSLLATALDRVLEKIPNATSNTTVLLDFQEETKDLLLKLDVDFDYTKSSPFSFDLPAPLGDLIALSGSGGASLALGARLKLGIGVNVGTFVPFITGDSRLDLTGTASGQDINFEAGIGGLKVKVGQSDAEATPESGTQCDAGNTVDDDGDGFVNDGCPPAPEPESGSACTGGLAGKDDDGDGIADDGCPGNTPAQEGDDPEADGQCTDADKVGKDDDGDGIADDGCNQPNPATAGPPTSETGTECDIANSADDDGDDKANDGCPPRADKARFFVGAKANLTVGPADTTDDATHYTLLGGGTPLSFQGGFDGDPQAPCTDVDIQGPDTVGPNAPGGTPKDACAILPLYFNGAPIGAAPTGHHVEVAVSDLTNPTAVSVQYKLSALTDLIGSQLLDLVLLNSGLESLFDALQSLLEGDLFSFALPIIGGQTANAADIVDGLRNTVKQAIATAVQGGNPLAGSLSAGNVQTVVENIAGAVLSAITGGGLQGSGGSVLLLCGDRKCDLGKGENDATNQALQDPALADTACDDGDPDDGVEAGNGVDDDGDGTTDDGCEGIAVTGDDAVEVTDVQLRFVIGGTVDVGNADLDGDGQPGGKFDIGIPGLNLEGNASPNGSLSWSLAFGFGVSKDDGFYFVTDSENAGTPIPELSLDATFGISPPNGEATISGQLAFLQVTIVDGDPALECAENTPDETPCRRAGDAQDPASSFGAHFKVDVTDPDDDGKLTFAELAGGPSFSDLIHFAFNAEANLNLHVETGFAGGSGLPKLLADLHMHWAFAIGDPNTLGSFSGDTKALNADSPGSNLQISLDSVGLDVGSYVTRFLKPLFKDVKRFTEPLKPVIDTITACIPVISDLSGSCESLLTIAQALAGDKVNFEFIKQIIAIVQFINALPTSAPGNLTIPIGDGSFNLSGATLQKGELPAEEARSAFAENISNLPSVLDGLNGQDFVKNAGSEGGQSGGIQYDSLKADGLGGIGLSFPIFQHPEKILTLLFGQDADIAVWEPPQLKVGFSYSQKFGPIWAVPPVFVEVGGSVSVTGRFGIGYTTKGLRNFLFNDQGPSALLQGLFLVDRHPLEGGPDSNELELTGELFANAQVSVLIFSAGAQGSIYLTIGIDLQDPNSDGRLEYDEAADIINSTGNVLCIFNLNGRFGVRISVFAEVDLFFWSHRWEFTLADIVLYEFKVECKPLPDPVLAHIDGSNVLVLHVGKDYGHLRDPEQFAAPPYHVQPGDDTSAFTNSPDGVLDNSVGKDVTAENFVVTRLPNGARVSALGVTQDYIGTIASVLGDASDAASVTDPDLQVDKLTMADGKTDAGQKLVFELPATLSGGTGADELTGGTGGDTLNGGPGNDKLTAKDGGNTVNGGGENDVINAGSGDDHLFGDAGEDRITAGTGGDEIVGGDGPDNIDGGRSTAAVPDGRDLIWGDNKDGTGTGNDFVDAGSGNDDVHVGNGKDRADGGDGNDTIDAGSASDPATCAGEADDVLIGSQGADDISAGGGDDIVIGGNVLSGQPDAGDTLLDGQDGCDTIFGDNAIQGSGGPFDVSALDPSIGAADTIRGGNQSDRIHGQLGGDAIRGDDDVAANDTDDGNDVIHGEEPGNAAGNDVIFGDGAEDTVHAGPGDDDVAGGTGPDHLFGDAGQDFVLGDDGVVNGNANRDAATVTLNGGNGVDDLHGGGDRDHLYGQGGGDTVLGDGGDDDAYGDGDDADPAHVAADGNDTVRGGVGHDYLFGNNGADSLFGDSGNDRIVGGSPNATSADAGVLGDGFSDHVFGDTGSDVMAGDNATITNPGAVAVLLAEAVIGEADLMYGDADDDAVFGENGDDTIHGGTGDDHAEGGDDHDTVFGEAGHDDLIGGTTEAAAGFPTGGQPDGNDKLYGGTEGDVVLGDNGLVSRLGAPAHPDGTPRRQVTLYDLDDVAGATSGTDELHGEDGNDSLYGGAERDLVRGHGGDDHAQGNNGDDDITGEAGQDDLIGGTSAEVDEDGSPTVGGNHPDTGKDVIQGGDHADVACGDNCSIRRFAGVGGWLADDLHPTAPAVVRRQVQLYDVATVAAPLSGTTTSDGDELYGDAEHDVAYGQGGNDVLRGGTADDYLEGGAGHDNAKGDAGQDDLVGGTGRTTSDDPATAVDGRLDERDDLFGGDGAGAVLPDTGDYDVVMGDNATVLRGDPPGSPGAAWETNTFNGSIKRALFLYDVATTTNAVDAGTNGPDLLRGEADDDLMYGQGDGDDMEGAHGDDYMEGNEGADKLLGQDGNDDMIGGTGRINNDPVTGTDGRLDSGEVGMSGGDRFDVMAGDNAIVTRVLSDPGGAWVPNTFNEGIQHNRIRLLDLQAVGSTVSPSVSGGDVMTGDAHDDVMYGQGNGSAVPETVVGGDDMKGNAGDDYVEGNAGGDRIEGNGDQDDLVGGTGRVNDDGPNGTDGRLDGNDVVFGDAGEGEGTDGTNDFDVILGDNAVVDRPVTDLPAGDWIENTFNDGLRRTVVLVDVEDAGGPAVDPAVHGDDTLWGNGDDDIIRAQGGNDLVHGGAGDDDMQGNHAVDRMWGDSGEDDMLGGSAVGGRLDAGDFVFGGTGHDVATGDNATIGRPLDEAGQWRHLQYGHLFGDVVPDPAAFDRVVRDVGMLDTAPGATSGSDVVNGNDGDDELYGQFDDTGDVAGTPVTVDCADGATALAVDDPNTLDADPTPVIVRGDLLCGEAGEDGVLGDQGVIVDVVETGPAQTLTHNGAPFVVETVKVPGTLTRRTTLSQIPAGGADVVLGDRRTNPVADGVQPAGDDAHDVLHAGAGDDLANGGEGDDLLFLADGADAGWGGDHDDHVWAGYGGDLVDVNPRTRAQYPPNGDPLSWFYFAADDPDTVDDPATEALEGYDGYRGFDLIYGGWDQDAMQANMGDNGPVAGDRLMDWAGVYNGYYLCPSTYGEYVSTRQQSPSLISYLQSQIEADGATTVTTGDRTTSSGFNELAMVFKPDIKENTSPRHPDTPAHFTCT